VQSNEEVVRIGGEVVYRTLVFVKPPFVTT